MTDLATRLDVRGRRIVVLAGPGDRRDEDIRAIAAAAAGRFDHYICRRDDGLRGRGADEVPQLLASELRERGVPVAAIEIIPDEQEAIAAALAMGRPGDLLMVFADALTRSWKQVIKFKPTQGTAADELAAAAHPAPTGLHPVGNLAGRSSPGDPAMPVHEDAALESTGFVRDERGLRFVPEASD
jgi:cyanophycin synthetase